MDIKDMRIPRSSVAGLDEAAICWAVVGPIWPTTETEDELALLGQGTNGQQSIYVTMLYAQEVDNGGLKQFFGNSSGMLWQRVRNALQLIDAQEQVAVINAAVEAFPGGMPPTDQNERRVALEALTQEKQNLWRATEDRIYARGGFFGTLQPLWTRYIEAHPDEFFISING